MSGHGRVLEYVNVELILDGYSARVIREWYTHIGGSPTRLQASTRYINYKNFDYVIPPKIEANPTAKEKYVQAMETITRTCEELEKECEIPREDAALLLPLGMITKIVDKRNVRSLIEMSHHRHVYQSLLGISAAYAGYLQGAQRLFGRMALSGRTFLYAEM